MSLHKCFVRFEDDFGSYWTVDDEEFLKRRHLTRGRPRKYHPAKTPEIQDLNENTAEIEEIDVGSKE